MPADSVALVCRYSELARIGHTFSDRPLDGRVYLSLRSSQAMVGAATLVGAPTSIRDGASLVLEG